MLTWEARNVNIRIRFELKSGTKENCRKWAAHSIRKVPWSIHPFSRLQKCGRTLSDSDSKYLRGSEDPGTVVVADNFHPSIKNTVRNNREKKEGLFLSVVLIINWFQHCWLPKSTRVCQLLTYSRRFLPVLADIRLIVATFVLISSPEGLVIFLVLLTTSPYLVLELIGTKNRFYFQLNNGATK